jgi:hypothetical protein
MDRRGPDQEMINKMYDAIELIYILNRLTNGSYCDDCSREYLVSMLDDVDSLKQNYDRYKFRDEDRRIEKRDFFHGSRRCDSFNCENKGNFVDKIIYFLQSLNE